MYPILFEWGPILLPSWHVFYMLGALVGYGLLLYLGRFSSSVPSKEDLSSLFIVCYAAGYFGARFLSIMVEEPQVIGFKDTLAAMFRFGPMTFYGGGIAAFLAGTLYCYFSKLRFADCLDIGMVAGFVALAVGRIGCFLNGDDYGKAAPMGVRGEQPIWAVVFPALGDGIPRWPVQLIEAIAVFLMAGCFMWVYLRSVLKLRPGMIGFLSIVLYADLRFGLEFLRDDFRGFVFGTWLSTSQFIAILTLAGAGCVAPLWLLKDNR